MNNESQLLDTSIWKTRTNKIIKERKEFAKSIKNRPSKKEPDILKNITDKWITFLKRDKRLKKNSFTTLNIGNRGGGKTAQTFKETNILLENPKRIVQFWKAPNSLIESIELVCPDNRKGRYQTINKLKNIKFNTIFCVDEGLLGINAKEALKIEMRDIIKFVSKSRHYNIICIINSVSLGILKQFREAIDIISYRRLSEMFIKNNINKDYTLMDYRDTLLTLKDWEGILFSSYKRFTAKGFISMKFEDYCPWFFDGISTYQSSTSPDVAFDEIDRLKDQHIRIVDWIINTVGSDFMEKNGKRNFKMWLYKNHTDMYQDNFKHLNTIYDLYLYTLTTNPKKNIRTAVLNRQGFETIDFSFKYNDFDVFNKIKRNPKIKRIRSKIKDAFEDHLETGATQTSLEPKYNVPQETLSRNFKKIKGAMRKERGTLHEKEYRKNLESLKINGKKVYDPVKRLGASGEPDILAYKLDTNELDIYSLKTIKKRHTIRKEKLEQEYTTALKEEPNYSKVRLFLTVYIRSEKLTIQKELDYHNPTDVIIK